MTETRKKLIECLRTFASDNIFLVSASHIAERLYPNTRSENANGQVFNLAAGVVGRQLRKYRISGVYEIKTGLWEIHPDLLPKKEKIEKE